MADEAVCIEPYTKVVRYTVADGTAIAKGTILGIYGTNTAAASSGADIFAGIAIEEKTASDGITELGCAIDGTWEITSCGKTITLGKMVVLSGANLIRDSVEADFPLGAVFGKCLESGSAGVRVRLGLN
jgi:hypothetical protein